MPKRLTEKEKIRRKIAGMSSEEVQALRQVTLAEFARLDDSPESFSCFYELIHGREIPDHAINEWITPLYEAKENKRGIVIEAFRGSTKTTTVTNTFTAYRIGKEPHRANLLIQVGDDIAEDNTEQIADIISNNPGWKLAFPNIVPDTSKGWGAKGYEVMDKSMPYSEWRKRNSSRKDPTLLGVGYKSRNIIGKHPDGVLVVDDIHDENNTSSSRELQNVRRILTGTIFPTVIDDTWEIFIGTPWTKDDCLNYVANTGEYVHVKTPVFRVAQSDNSKVVDGEDFDDQKVTLTWSDKFDIAEITRQKNKAGTREFARMFLLDLTQSYLTSVKYFTYPNELIEPRWAYYGGIDYASYIDVFDNPGANRSKFAMVYGAKIPTGGFVITDGVVEICSQTQAEVYAERAQGIFPNWNYTVIEGDGKGEEFIGLMARKPHVKIVPMKTGGRSKKNRQESMFPWLENGTVRISDADTRFLNTLRDALDRYPEGNEDVRDALFWVLKAVPDVLVFPEVEEGNLPKVKKKKKENPYKSLARM